MRLDRRTQWALTLFAAFIGSAAMATPATFSAFSSLLNADGSLNGPRSAGVQFAAGPAAAGAAFQSAERPPLLTLAKTKKQASPAEACAAKCDKAYRYCYSQGAQAGKPDVPGGQPCQEQKDTCLRACPT
jgi:hypothetical protein